MRVLSTIPFTLYRMFRNFIVLLLLLIVPIILLTVFSFVLGDMRNEAGMLYFQETALTMVLVFQLFGGSIVMYMIHNDLLTIGRMRMRVAPFNSTLYAFSIMMCGSLFSIILGVLLMFFSQFVLGVVWEHWLWMLYLIFLMSVLSSIVCLIFTFSVKNYKLAERLSEVYGVGFVALAGLFFPMPQNAFFDFFGSYGNPLMLAVGAIEERGRGNLAEAWLQANLLLGAVVVLFLLMVALGRRRLR